MPGAWPVWTPGAPLAAFIKESIIHWSTYKGEYYTLVHTTYESSGPYGFREEDFFMFFPWHPRGGACMDSRGMVGRIFSRIYKEDHFTLLHTKYESFGPCGFGEEDFLTFFPWRPWGRARMDPMGRVGRIYKEDHYTLLHTKYESPGSSGFGGDFFMFYPWPPPPPGAGPKWTPGAWLAGFIKRTTIHCYTQNMKALGLVVSKKKKF